MDVQNMTSSKGNKIPNQFIITGTDGSRYFQSYKSTIAKIDPQGRVTLGPSWDYSKTTGKYRNQFLGETKAETEKKIKSGEYTLVDAIQ